MRELLNKKISSGIIAALLISVTACFGAVFHDNFEAYEVENPSDFSTNGVPTGNWVPSSNASNASRMFSTGNYGNTKLWISDVNGTSITSAGITVESNTQYRLSVCLVLDTFNHEATGTASYDILLGTDAATAVSLGGGPVEVTVRGDNAGGAANGNYNDQITTALFNVGALEPGEKLFLVFKRIEAAGWFGIDNVVINKTKPSGRLKYSYGMSVQPDSQNLDGVNGNDFQSGSQIPLNGQGFAVETTNTQNKIFRTDFPNSIWRTQFLTNRDYTVEFRARIGTNGIEGTSGTLGHAAARDETELKDAFDLTIKRTGYGTDGIGAGEDNTGWHTYRIACSESGNQVWRDGVPINGRILPLAGSAPNRTWFGDWGMYLGGEFHIDYYRLDPTGAYAPATAVEPGTKLQWSLGYTSGNVANQNGGKVVDSSGNGNHGIKHWNHPIYSADIPPATKLQNCTGIGSFDFATTGHTAVKTVNNNIITIEEVVAAGGVTMEVWAKQTMVAGSNAVIMTMQDALSIASPSGKYKVAVNAFDNDGPEYTISEDTKISAGWTHLAAIVRNLDVASEYGTNYICEVELWVNGELAESKTLDFAPALDLTRPSGAGSALNSASGDYRWDGYVYEPRITLGVVDPKEFTCVQKIRGTVMIIQ